MIWCLRLVITGQQMCTSANSLRPGADWLTLHTAWSRFGISAGGGGGSSCVNLRWHENYVGSSFHPLCNIRKRLCRAGGGRSGVEHRRIGEQRTLWRPQSLIPRIVKVVTTAIFRCSLWSSLAVGGRRLFFIHVGLLLIYLSYVNQTTCHKQNTLLK